MKIITTPIQDFKLEYPLEAFSPLTDILFLDIETTGLLPRHSNIYLIGCIYFADPTPILKQ